MEIKPYKFGDEQEILTLFRESFGKKMDESFWRWRYEHNPFLNELMVHMMWDGDVLVGHYAVSPIEMIINGQRVMTALSMTTMTHPEYSGRGIFTKLANSLYRTISLENGISAVWGFPNANSHYGFINKLGWKDVATVPFLTLELNMQEKVNLVDFKIHSEFSEELSQVLKECCDGRAVSINKTVNYLNWRYTKNPVNDYIILSVNQEGVTAVVVFKFISSFSTNGYQDVDILELGAPNDYLIIELLVNAMISYAQDCGVNIAIMNVWLSLSDKRHLLLEKIGFKLASPVTYLSYIGLNGPNELMSKYESWDLSLGYSDVF